MKLYLQKYEPGSGSAKINLNDPAAVDLDYGKFVRLSYRGAIRGGFLIDNIQRIEAAQGDEGGRWISVSGRGPLSILDDARVWYVVSGETTRSFVSVSRGEILHTFLLHAKARNALNELIWDFNDLEDSDGVAWTDLNTLDFRVGTSLLDVVRQFMALGTEIKMSFNWSANQYVLQAFQNSQDKDLSQQVVFRVGDNCKEVTATHEASGLKNAYLIELQNGAYAEINDAVSMTNYRRREAFFQAGQTTDVGQAEALASVDLAETKAPKTSIAVQLNDAAGPRAFVDYDLGDTVSVAYKDGALAAYRIIGMQLDWEDSQYATITVELNSVQLDAELRNSIALRKLSPSVSSSTSSVPDLNTTINAAFAGHNADVNAHPGLLQNAVKLQGRAVSAALPDDGQALIWSSVGVTWEPGFLDARYYTKTEINAAFADHNADVNAHPGLLQNAVKLQGRAVSATLPDDGQALIWSSVGVTWEPGFLDARYYTETELDAMLANKVNRTGDTMTGTLAISGGDLEVDGKLRLGAAGAPAYRADIQDPGSNITIMRLLNAGGYNQFLMSQGTVANVYGVTAGLAFVGSNSSHPFQLRVAASEKIRLDTGGNLLLGTTISPSAGGGKVLAFGDNAGDPTMGGNTAGIYAKDVAGTVEVFAVDEAGNTTQISPHSAAMIPDNPSHEAPWYHRSKNAFTGIEVEVDMFKLARLVEQLSGEQLIWLRQNERQDWDAVQRAHAAARKAEIAAWKAMSQEEQKQAGTPCPKPYKAKRLPDWIKKRQEVQI